MALLRRFRERRKFRKWLAAGRPDPPPPLAKQEMLRDYAQAHELDVLVETGTFRGDTVEAMRRQFRFVHSIELAPKFYELASRRLGGVSNVQLHFGDSGKLLEGIVAGLESRTLFWLDGHYSGGDTALGDSKCPVREELAAIFDGMKHPFVVLIDDARCFTKPKGTDYPSIEEIREIVAAKKPDMRVEVAMDCIRIVPV